MENKSLFSVTHWGNVAPDEIRVELFGNGHYFRAWELAAFLRNNADAITAEVCDKLRQEIRDGGF